jgi:hypothetical protein
LFGNLIFGLADTSVVGLLRVYFGNKSSLGLEEIFVLKGRAAGQTHPPSCPPQVSAGARAQLLSAGMVSEVSSSVSSAGAGDFESLPLRAQVRLERC